MTISRMPEFCQGCDRPVRQRSTTLEQFPGTTLYACHGYCSACYRLVRYGQPTEADKAKQIDPKDVIVRTDRRNTQEFLKQISADRQRLEQRAKVRMVIR